MDVHVIINVDLGASLVSSDDVRRINKIQKERYAAVSNQDLSSNIMVSSF